MANRIILKKIVHEDGREETAHDLICSLLRRESNKSFGEIKQFLEKSGVAYANNKGLDLALKSLISKGDIGKHKIVEKSHPTYYIKKKGLNYIASVAQEFQRGVVSEISKWLGLPREDSESAELYLIKNLIHIYGLYNLYVQIKSWRFTSNKKSHGENFDIRRTWLRYTLPLGSESHLLEEGIKDLAGLRFHGTTAEFNESVARIYANEKKWKKFLELEELLKKMYPDEIEFFEKIFTKSPDEATRTREWIRGVQRREAWKKRLIRKSEKESKKQLKANECPRCHYDGSTKVKAGPCKGRIFEKGFVLEPGIEHQGKHCPACGYWENVKNS